MALLLVAVIMVAIADSVQGSISAYYLGPIRDVFVATLVGIAVCLVVYRGSSAIEDYALNLAGFFAFFVAFVPTDLAETLATLGPEERAEALTAVRISTASVILVSALFIFAESRTDHFRFPGLLKGRRTKWIVGITYLLLAAFFVLIVVTGFFNDSFQWVHLSAAILLFVGMALAVASHNWLAEPEVIARDGRRYRFLVVLMGAGVLIAVALWQWPYVVFALEAYEVACFATFWIMEAIRTWRPPIGR
jgi:hypothetical protein